MDLIVGRLDVLRVVASMVYEPFLVHFFVGRGPRALACFPTAPVP
jgi:hypothetical protein